MVGRQRVPLPLLTEPVGGNPQVDARPAAADEQRAVAQDGRLGRGAEHVVGQRRRRAPRTAAICAPRGEEGQRAVRRLPVAGVLSATIMLVR